MRVQVKEHDRKAKRAAKKNPALRKKLHKDPGIPNMNPFKQQMLRKVRICMHHLRRRVSVPRVRTPTCAGSTPFLQLSDQQRLLGFQNAQNTRREQELAARRKLAGGSALGGLAAHASARGATFAADAEAGDASAAALLSGERELATVGARAGEQSRRAFFKHLRLLLEKADVLLEVLDARDPLACRCPAIEALALSSSPPKRIVLVLNKIDLVPPSVAVAWLAYLRREFPTVAFKASTQAQRDHLSARGGAAINSATEAGEVMTGSGAAGTDTLMQLIKNYSRSSGGGGVKAALTVGVVGYPNVGKSSLINSLKRQRATAVSSTPGHTRALQEVSLDGKVTIIDCPGIIFDDDEADREVEGGDVEGANGAAASLLLRNCVSVDSIADPEAVVAGIVARCLPSKLMAVYAIPSFADAQHFLRLVATRRGKLGRGGVADTAAAARAVLQDWNAGRIPFYVLPPEDDVAAGAAGAEDDDMGGAAAGAGAPTGVARGPAAAAGDAAGVGSAALVSSWAKVIKSGQRVLLLRRRGGR